MSKVLKKIVVLDHLSCDTMSKVMKSLLSLTVHRCFSDATRSVPTFIDWCFASTNKVDDDAKHYAWML